MASQAEGRGFETRRPLLRDVLALQGKVDEARELFERLLDLRNDVGLLAEDDPVAVRQLGNFPQAFTHLALVNTAIVLARVAACGTASKVAVQRADESACPEEANRVKSST